MKNYNPDFCGYIDMSYGPYQHPWDTGIMAEYLNAKGDVPEWFPYTADTHQEARFWAYIERQDDAINDWIQLNYVNEPVRATCTECYETRMLDKLTKCPVCGSDVIEDAAQVSSVIGRYSLSNSTTIEELEMHQFLSEKWSNPF